MYVNYSTILSGMKKKNSNDPTNLNMCVNFLCVFFDMFWNRDENLNGMEKTSRPCSTSEAEAKTQKISVPKSDFLLLNAGRPWGEENVVEWGVV